MLSFAVGEGALAAPQADGGGASAPMCPVMTDEPIDPSVSTEWEGRRVYFCCKMCRKDFLADPQAYRDAVPPESAYATFFGEASDTKDAGDTANDAAEVPAGAADADAQTRGALATAASASEPARSSRPTGPHLLERLGRFHVTIVHFPIALLLVAALAELLRRRDVGRFCTGLAALTAVLAAALGWLAAEHANYPTMTTILFRHRWLGVGTAVLAVAAWWLSLGADEPRHARLYRAALFVAAALVLVTAHHGGSLIFGPGWLLG